MIRGLQLWESLQLFSERSHDASSGRGAGASAGGRELKNLNGNSWQQKSSMYITSFPSVDGLSELPKEQQERLALQRHNPNPESRFNFCQLVQTASPFGWANSISKSFEATGREVTKNKHRTTLRTCQTTQKCSHGHPIGLLDGMSAWGSDWWRGSFMAHPRET